MAKNKDKSNINMTAVQKLQQSVQDNLSSLYTSVKFSDPANSNTIEYMRSRMHRSIDKLMSNNTSNTGMTNISSLFLRTKNIQNDQSIIDGIASAFENETLMGNLMGIYSQNVHLKEFDKEIEIICKYMPKLREAMDTRKEMVLSADHFSKNSINISTSSSVSGDITSINNIKEMKEKYEIDELLEQIYEETDYKGECFVYIVPYKKAIAKLLNRTNNGVIQTEATRFYVEENSIELKEKAYTGESVTDGIVFEFNKTGVLESAITSRKKAEKALNEYASLAVNESVKTKKEKNIKDVKHDKNGVYSVSSAWDTVKSTITIDNDKAKETFYKMDPTSQDGFVATDKTSEEQLKVPGCVVKVLDHTMVKPLYMDDICIGYLYMECDKEFDLEQTTMSSTLGGIRPGGAWRDQSNQFNQDNVILKKLASEISDKIDKKFVNANQDLTKEIYFILKYNKTIGSDGRISKVKINFIPPEDMVHSYFDKDPKTNRGISGLVRAMFPSKLFSCLYISNVITILTRGQDKRIYRIKQSVDTNIAAVLLSTINQIKKSNFGLRQIENLNNIMNITGRFNDHIVPVGPNGETPVEMEVLPGQNVEVKTDLMNLLEEMAVNSTDVPIEVVNARLQVDYATHYTMTNTKFLRKVYNRQAKTKRISDKVLTKIYNAEFETEESIDTTLPPPMYLNLINTGQIFDTANQLAQNSTDMWAGDEDQEVQLYFMRGVKKDILGSYLPLDKYDKLLEEAKMQVALKPKDQQQ